MNILIPHSWLKDYLETKATPQKIAGCLSLCGASVEKINKTVNDFVYDIEVTTNRVDMMSVLGIAREAAVILPQFNIKARLKTDPYEELKTLARKRLTSGGKNLELKVIIKNKLLCPRFTAVILDNITIKPSPKIIQERLRMAGMRPLNNIVDITNYLMKELGQPYHAFDWQEIKKQTMILRTSRRGEKITTLDGQTHILPGNDIVIEDGSGRLIDLCGIMGGSNSHIDDKTKTILLFVQTYDPIHIRRTSISLGKRTEAATLFEKSPDPEMIIPALYKGIELIKKFAGARVASKIFDIYPQPYRPKRVKISIQKIKEQLGVDISKKEVVRILESLGFKILTQNSKLIAAQVPSWRASDVSIPEDLIEEIARIYGYHNLPTLLPTGEFPKPFKGPFFWEEKTKDCLKNWGFTEIYNYSLVSSNLLKKSGFDPQNFLKLSNPLTSEWEYMRPSLIPGILKTVADNQSREEEIRIFELSNIYLPRKGKLPNEKPILIGAITGEKFYKAKGIVEALLEELGIKMVTLEHAIASPKVTIQLWHPGRTAIVTLGRSNLSGGSTSKTSTYKALGTVGEIHPSVLEKFEIEGRVTVFELNFEEILKHATTTQKYTPIPKYPPIVEDLAFLVPEKTLVGKMMDEIKKTSKLVAKVTLLDSYKNTRTFRIAYQHPKRTLTDQEVKKIREKTIKKLRVEFKAELRST